MTASSISTLPHLFIFWFVSFFIHSLVLMNIKQTSRLESAKIPQPVNIKLTEKPKPVAKVASQTPLPKVPRPETRTMTPSSAAKKSEPVLGLSKDSFRTDDQGAIAVPAGNTTMTEDKGQRLSPEQIQKLSQDLSEDAKLVPGSFIKPEYTAEAEDAGLQGTFVVEIYVDSTGAVGEVELRTKIGFGMDQRVLEAARKSRFFPRKNPLGQAYSGWTELKIRLTLE